MSGQINKRVLSDLDAELFFENLTAEARGLVNKCVILDKIDSTNTWLKDKAKKELSSDGTVVIANQQTAGRGRLGRSFYSPAQTGLYFSLLLEPQKNASSKTESKELSNFNPALYTAAAAVAVARTLEEHGIPSGIKWVNDVYCNNKKVCGILTEGIFTSSNAHPQYIIVGIGVNISTENFPEELITKASSLLHSTENFSVEREVFINRTELCAHIVSHFFEIITQENETFMHEYKQKSCVLGKSIDVISPQETYAAIARDIDSEGNLIVELDTGETRQLCSGEISIKPIK